VDRTHAEIAREHVATQLATIEQFHDALGAPLA
jgi:hypothetical protein